MGIPWPDELVDSADVLVVGHVVDHSPRRLWLELPELDRWARRRGVLVIVPWRMRKQGEEVWVPRLAAVSSWLVHVHDIAWDKPVSRRPSYYRVPATVYVEGARIREFSLRLPAARRDGPGSRPGPMLTRGRGGD